MGPGSSETSPPLGAPLCGIEYRPFFKRKKEKCIYFFCDLRLYFFIGHSFYIYM
jgi:hypothetical protein